MIDLRMLLSNVYSVWSSWKSGRGAFWSVDDFGAQKGLADKDRHLMNKSAIWCMLVPMLLLFLLCIWQAEHPSIRGVCSNWITTLLLLPRPQVLLLKACLSSHSAQPGNGEQNSGLSRSGHSIGHYAGLMNSKSALTKDPRHQEGKISIWVFAKPPGWLGDKDSLAIKERERKDWIRGRSGCRGR